MGYVIVPESASLFPRTGPFVAKRDEVRYTDSLNQARFFMYRDVAEDACSGDEVVVPLDVILPGGRS